MAQSSSRLGGVVTVITTSGALQTTAGFGAQVYKIRLANGGANSAHFKIGDPPVAVATAADSILPSQWSEYFTVSPGQQVSVIQAGSATTISVTELADG